jgi:hypothetical protein
MIHPVGNVIDLVVHLVAGEELTCCAASGAQIFGHLAQVCRHFIGVVVERFVVDEFAG